MKGSHPRPADRCPFVLSISQVTSFMQLGMLWRDNSGPIQAKVTKFGLKIQNTLVKVPIVLCSDQPWFSILTWKSKFTPSWACHHHNSSPIHTRISKFGPEVKNPGGGTHYVRVMGRLRGIDPPFSRHWKKISILDPPFSRCLRKISILDPLF